MLLGMGTKSKESLYGAAIRASEERAREARREADKLACEAWNNRMLGYKGPAQPSPTLGDALNAGYGYLEVRCLGCDTHQTVALDIVRARLVRRRYLFCHAAPKTFKALAINTFPACVKGEEGA
jgi:hypothetical protein